jgi:hypothetical protein
MTDCTHSKGGIACESAFNTWCHLAFCQSLACARSPFQQLIITAVLSMRKPCSWKSGGYLVVGHSLGALNLECAQCHCTSHIVLLTDRS